jgi:NAD(P)-dependent dehydrogenase (short-subunit alcohol dehydrogenase family)
VSIDLGGKTYWLVGASEGLGRALSQALAAEGVRLCLSARNGERLAELAAELPGDPICAPCDVREMASVAEAFAALPPLDGVIYSAGVYEPVRAEAWDVQAVEAMCDVNFTGAARVLGQAVPGLVAGGGGHIVLVGSLAGYRGLPGAVGYASSKAGLMHLTECLAIDLPPDSFTVQVVNPGFIKTRLTDKNDFDMPHIMSAAAAASEVVRAMKGGRFRTDFPAGFAWRFRIARCLPDSLYLRLLRSSR